MATQRLIPAWLWILVIGQTRITCDGVHLTIDKNGFLWETTQQIKVGSLLWRQWIADHDRFNYSDGRVHCLFQKERRRHKYYWYAYKWHKHGKRAERVYVGKLEELSPMEIRAKVWELEEKAQLTLKELARRRRELERMRRRRKRRRALARAKLARRHRSYGGSDETTGD